MVFKSNKLLVRLFLVGTIASSPLIAMDRDEITPSSESTVSLTKAAIPTTKEGYVAARTRFALLQDLLKDHPSLIETQRIPSKDTLWHLYEADRDFIKKAISNRQQKDNINQYIQLIETRAKERKWNESMSLSDLTFVGQCWVSLLSSHHTSFNPSYYEEAFKFYDKTLAQLEKIRQQNPHTYWGIPEFPWVRNMPSFVMPHISPTGSVPIPITVKTWGFFAPNGSAYGLDLWAVPTNEKVNFDYFRNKGGLDSWRHDNEHSSRSERLADNDDVRESHRKSANFYLQLEKNLNKEELKLAHLAHHHVFHERQCLIENLEDTIAKNIKNVENILSQKDIIPGEYFNSIEQFETYIKGAESLKIPLRGKTTIEKYRCLLEKKLEGLKLLKKYAPAYDESAG